jgi:outer membrane protein assembly factor BamD (BamD/ComL family)
MASSTVSPSPTTTTTAPTLPKAAASDQLPVPAWLRNPRLVGGVLGAVALVAATVWFLNSIAKRKEAFAASALNQARGAAEAGNLPLAASELQKLTTTFKGTRAALEGTLVLNQVRLLNNQAELAVGGLKEFLASNPPREFAAQGHSMLGVALENTQKPAEAALEYAKAAELAEVDFLKAQHHLDAGRAFAEAGKVDEAVKSYREVVQKYPKTNLVTEAKVRLAELTKGAM